MNAVLAPMGRGAGRKRDKWGIRKFLDENNTNMRRESIKLGVFPQVFQDTVQGIRNDRRVLKHLKEMGCPEIALSLPEDLQ